MWGGVCVHTRAWFEEPKSESGAECVPVFTTQSWGSTEERRRETMEARDPSSKLVHVVPNHPHRTWPDSWENDLDPWSP